MTYLQPIAIKFHSFLKTTIFPIKPIAIRNLKHCSKTCYGVLPVRNSVLYTHHFHHLPMIVNFQIKHQSNYSSLLIIIHSTKLLHTFRLPRFILSFLHLILNFSFYFFLFC
jgi:hypothetical protein